MNIKEIQCCVAGCGHSPFPMAESFYNRAKRTHEFWHCPAGHEQHFTGKSEAEKLRDELRWANNRAESWKAAYDKWRTQANQCPWPTCRDYVYSGRSSLYDHMRRIHGMPLLAAVRDAS